MAWYKNTARWAVSLLLRQGAQLRPENIIAEYRRGRFPMTERFGRIVWHDPEPRAILPLDARFHVPSLVRKLIQRNTFSVTFDTAFTAVVSGCAERTSRRPYSWITPEIAAAYTRLHRMGVAHSVEVWRDGTLVGGGYGVAIQGLYCGESNFSRESDASKVGLAHLGERLQARGFVLHDAQESSNLSRQFGVVEVSRGEYRTLLAKALAVDTQF